MTNSNIKPNTTENIKFTLLGLLLAGVTIIIIPLFPTGKALDLLVILLAVIGAIYIGFALKDGRPRETAIELGFALLTILLAIVGLWFSPYILALGYFLHGAWDIIHHPNLIQTHLVRWWPPFCLVYDWLMAGFILFWWSGIVNV